MRRRTVTLAALTAAGLVVMTGCSAGSSSGSSSAGSSAARAAVGDASAASAPLAAARSGTEASVTAATPAALIRTGEMSLSVTSNAAVATAATRATGFAHGSGGRVDADSRTSSTGHADPASATLVLRVPNAALDAVTRQLASLGTVRSQQLQTRDVTAQVADVTSRVTSARAAIAGLNRLYARAATVRDLITVESSLAARQSNLEALEAQQRTLAAQTSLATLTLSIDVRAPTAKPHQHPRSGFGAGLHNGWDAFTTTGRGIAAAAGAVLLFGLVVLVLAAAGALVIRPRRTQPVPDPEP